MGPNDQKLTEPVYITRFATTTGVFEVGPELGAYITERGMLCVPAHGIYYTEHYAARDWAPTIEEARAKYEEAHRRKIKSLEKNLAKMLVRSQQSMKIVRRER